MAYEGLKLSAWRSKRLGDYKSKRGLVLRGGQLLTAAEAKAGDLSKPRNVADVATKPAAVERIPTPEEARAEMRAAIAESQGLPVRPAAPAVQGSRSSAVSLKRSAEDVWTRALVNLGHIPKDQAPPDNSAATRAWNSALASMGHIDTRRAPSVAGEGISQRSADAWNRALVAEGCIDRAAGKSKFTTPRAAEVWDKAVASAFPNNPAM